MSPAIQRRNNAKQINLSFDISVIMQYLRLNQGHILFWYIELFFIILHALWSHVRKRLCLRRCSRHCRERVSAWCRRIDAANFEGEARARISRWFFGLFCVFFHALGLQAVIRYAVEGVVVTAASQRANDIDVLTQQALKVSKGQGYRGCIVNFYVCYFMHLSRLQKDMLSKVWSLQPRASARCRRTLDTAEVEGMARTRMLRWY